MHLAHRTAPRLTALLAAALLGLCAVATHAEQLSPSVVLVLKLVAADRVQPVTGVVVSNDGLVLVPAEFVAEEEAEIIVLDGGTDIIANGRHAEVVKRVPESGVALLAADGLWRQGITLSDASMLEADQRLTLQAYPPAQSIAAGEGPLLLSVSLAKTGPLNADTNAHLPNVTGALLDGCGHLVALRVADGAQDLAPTPTATLLGADALAAVIGAVNPEVERATCAPPMATAPARIETESTSTAEPAGSAEELQNSTEKTPRTRPSPVTPGTPVDIGLAEENATQPLPEDQPVEPEAPAEPDATPAWLLPAGLLILVLLAWRYAVANRSRRNTRAGGVQPASDEPDTVRLVAADDDPLPVMRTGLGSAADLPLPDSLPDGCNGLVVLDGAAETALETRAFCAVDLDDFEALVGRGGADLDIAHPAVSRRHARITGRHGSLTIEDLNSSNGTYLNRAPCLAGEVLYLEAGTEIWLGEWQCTIRLLGKEQLAP